MIIFPLQLFNSSGITDNEVQDGTFALMFSGNGTLQHLLSTEDGTIGYVGMYYSRNYSAEVKQCKITRH